MATARILLSSVLIGLAWALPLVRATPVDAEPRAEPTAERLRKALDQVVSLDLQDVSLEDLLTRLNNVTKLHFVADRAAAVQLVASDVPGASTRSGVSFHVEKTRLRQGFERMLRDYGLDYAIVGETVLIAFAQQAVALQMSQPTTLNIKETPLSTALKQIGRNTGTNIVLDARLAKEAASPVTLSVQDVALENAVRVLANMAGLRTVRVGKMLYVTRTPNAVELEKELGSQTPASTTIIRTAPTLPRGGFNGFGGGGRRGRGGPGNVP